MSISVSMATMALSMDAMSVDEGLSIAMSLVPVSLMAMLVMSVSLVVGAMVRVWLVMGRVVVGFVVGLVGSVALGVLDISHIAIVTVDIVVHGLKAAIGKVDVVLALGLVAVTLLALAKVGAVVLVLNPVAVLVVGRVVVFLLIIAEVLVVVAVVRKGKNRGSHKNRGQERGEKLERETVWLVCGKLWIIETVPSFCWECRWCCDTKICIQHGFIL